MSEFDPEGFKILALVTDGVGARGGIARYNQDVFQAWESCSEISQNYVVALGGDTSHQSERLVQRAYKSRIGFVLRGLWWSITSKPDIVFCGHINLVLFSYCLARITGARFWVQVHGVEAWSRPSRLVRIVCARADLISSVSRYTKNEISRWLAPQTAKSVVISNTFSAPKPLGRDSRLTPKLKETLEGKKVLLSIGRLDRREQYKGHDRVIRVMRELSRVLEDEVVYVICGDGDDLSRLRNLARECLVEDKCIFTGYLDDDARNALIEVADLFVLPSTGEGFGIVYLEALSRGLPVLGFSGCGSSDPLQDGNYGKLSSPDRLLQDIKELLLTAKTIPLQNLSASFGFPAFCRRVQHSTRALLKGV
ncbi:MAG: glycosyltransferase family 4 protein [Pseudomonadales bacterium]|nr:glycosyltransferase family 4 protein [Pseudomonadales bacterium]